MREAFSPLSDATIALLKAAPPSDGVAEDGATVYVTHCPMVNHDWLQVGDAIRNPYATYMLNCGVLEEALPHLASASPTSTPAPGATDAR